MAIKSLDRQLKSITWVMAYDEICASRKCHYLLQSNRHRQAESCSRWSCSDSGPYYDSNIKSGNETYASHLIFKQ